MQPSIKNLFQKASLRREHFFSLFCIILFSCGNPTTSTVTEIKSAGQSLFENNCTACHGTDGKLCALGAKNLSTSQLTTDEVIKIIATGKNSMPSFNNMLNKSEMEAVSNYVQTLKK